MLIDYSYQKMVKSGKCKITKERTISQNAEGHVIEQQKIYGLSRTLQHAMFVFNCLL